MLGVVPTGEAVQVEPMKPKLKPPETMRLEPECENVLSHFAFKFNFRRYQYTKVPCRAVASREKNSPC